MDRTKAAEILHKARVCYATEYLDCHMVCDMCKYHVEDSLVVEAMDTAIKALEGKDTNVPAKWIPFTAETMPKEDGEYFVLYDDKYAEDYDTGSVGVADFYEDCEAFGYWQSRYDPVTFGFVDSDFIEIKVKKWMPIPKEEGEENGQTDKCRPFESKT